MLSVPRLATASRPAATTNVLPTSMKASSSWRLASSTAAPRSLRPLIAPRRPRVLVSRAAKDDKVREHRGDDGNWTQNGEEDPSSITRSIDQSSTSTSTSLEKTNPPPTRPRLLLALLLSRTPTSSPGSAASGKRPPGPPARGPTAPPSPSSSSPQPSSPSPPSALSLSLSTKTPYSASCPPRARCTPRSWPCSP